VIAGIPYQDLIVYISIPITTGIIGWFTNWLAVQMIFAPREFKGIWKLGWQGIIPHHSVKMSGLITRILTERLIEPEELYKRIDPEKITELISGLVDFKARELVEKLIKAQNPMLWNVIPDFVKSNIIDEVRKQIPNQIRDIYHEFGKDLDQAFDLESVVSTSLSGKNTSYLIEMFRRCGGPEFSFIVKSGLWFGLGIGLLQLAFIHWLNQWWVMPIMGLIVGYVTNWLALQMIFRPLEPRKFFGFIYYQGLFLKRQPEVSYEFADVLEKRVFHSENLIRMIFEGRGGDLLIQLVRDKAAEGVDKAVKNTPVIPMMINDDQRQLMKEQTANMLVGAVPQVADRVETYIVDALDIKQTVARRLSFLPPSEFEELLHSVFKEDELTLIALGAFLGGLVGLLQAFLVFFS
tara:strand:+ start:106151 stop:107371 length:1221 start_codon:yes stop_codon:yes gene_type:complete